MTGPSFQSLYFTGGSSRLGMVLLCWGLILLLPGRGEDPAAPRTYTVADCLLIGLERSALLANVRRDAEIAQARVQQAAAAAWPQLEVRGNYTRADKVQEITLDDRSIAMGTLNRYSAVLEGQQLLYAGGKVGAGIAAARLARQYAEHGVKDAQALMVRDITAGFYDLLLAEAVVTVRRASLEHLQSMLQEATLKNQHDLMSEFEVLSAQVRLANERPLLIRAVNQCEMARNEFRDLLNLEESEFSLDGKIAMAQPQFTDLESALQAGSGNRPAILRMRALVNIRRQDLRAAQGDWLPELRAFGNYGAANPDPHGESEAEDEWGWQWSAGLTAAWKLSDGDRRRGVIREKRLALAKQQEDLRELVKNVRLEIRQAWLRVQHAAEAVQGSEENVALARRALQIAQVRFAQGLSTYLELTETNLALSTAELTRLQALHDHIHAVAQLHYASGWDPEL